MVVSFYFDSQFIFKPLTFLAYSIEQLKLKSFKNTNNVSLKDR